jgi:hypothetical protein
VTTANRPGWDLFQEATIIAGQQGPGTGDFTRQFVRRRATENWGKLQADTAARTEQMLGEYEVKMQAIREEYPSLAPTQEQVTAQALRKLADKIEAAESDRRIREFISGELQIRDDASKPSLPRCEAIEPHENKDEAVIGPALLKGKRNMASDPNRPQNVAIVKARALDTMRLCGTPRNTSYSIWETRGRRFKSSLAPTNKPLGDFTCGRARF